MKQIGILIFLLCCGLGALAKTPVYIAEATGDTAYLKLPFISGGVSSESRQYNEAVEQGKRRLAAEDPNIHYVDLEGCELRSDDHLHFNGVGCREAADRICRRLESLGLVRNIH